MLYWLIIITIALLFFSIWYTEDLLAPPCIFCLMFSFALYWVHYGSANWGFEMNRHSFNYLLIGIIDFCVVALIVERTIGYKLNKKVKKSIAGSHLGAEEYGLSEVVIQRWKIMAILCIFSAFAMIYFLLLIRTAGASSFSTLASTFRNRLMSQEIDLPFIARFCMNMMRGGSVVIICVIVNNILVKRFRSNYGILLLICVVIYLALTLLSGERTSTLRVIAIFVLSYGVLWNHIHPNKNLISLKYIIGGVLSIIVILYLFSAIRFFIGRSSQLEVFDYIAFYAGGPIYNFDSFAKSFSEPTMTGEWTFLGLFNNLARLGFGTVRTVSRASVVISSRGIYMGNVYTCFYDYIMDYGTIGLIVLVAIYSLCVNALYYYAKYSLNKTILTTTIFVFFSTTLFFVGFTEQFFSTYITIATIEMFVEMLVLEWFLYAKKIGPLHYSVRRRR